MKKVAIVGCGYVCSARHIPAWKKIRDVDIVAVADVNLPLAKSVASLNHVSRIYDSFTEMFDKENLDIVDICTPPQTHRDIAIKAMERGYDVLCEKPLAMTTKEVVEIQECQKKAGVRFGVIHNLLFRLPVIEASQIIKRGDVGKILGVNVEMLNTQDDHMTKNRDHWSHRLPAGRFGETLAHPIYLIRHFLGDNLNVENVMTRKAGSYPWMRYDEMQVQLGTNHGIGNIYLSFNCPREHIVVSIYGEREILKVDLISSMVNRFPHIPISPIAIGLDTFKQVFSSLTCVAGNTFKAILGKYPTGHDINIGLFVDSIKNNKEGPVTIQDAYEVIRVLEDTCRKLP